jgi:hypothetical protein
MIYFEPKAKLDKAIIKIENEKVTYSFDLLVECFMDMGMSYIESVEYIDFNLSCVSVKNWPVIQEDIGV